MSNLLVQNIKHTNGTTAQTIDSSGRVKMPSQVLFQGVSETLASSKFTTYIADATGDSYTLNLTSIGGVLNIGGHFNVTTGIFTAPIDGIYEFHAGFQSRNNNTSRKIGALFVNGSNIGELFESASAYADGGRSFFADLNANDTVQLGDAGDDAFSVCSFSGRLIQ